MGTDAPMWRHAGYPARLTSAGARTMYPLSRRPKERPLVTMNLVRLCATSAGAALVGLAAVVPVSAAPAVPELHCVDGRPDVRSADASVRWKLTRTADGSQVTAVLVEGDDGFRAGSDSLTLPNPCTGGGPAPVQDIDDEVPAPAPQPNPGEQPVPPAENPDPANPGAPAHGDPAQEGATNGEAPAGTPPEGGLPEGFDPKNLPEGFDPKNLPPGVNPADLPAGVPGAKKETDSGGLVVGVGVMGTLAVIGGGMLWFFVRREA